MRPADMIGRNAARIDNLSEQYKKKNRQGLNFSCLAIFCVGVLGLEPRMTGPESVPRMTGPESVVLPLHHTPI